ncbi:flagellar basal body rod protein FlgB [Buchnera aphidicola]|uniref:Flagellar basal body rod protein FlgB n=1 Tax=Buchnera aphidicola str. Ua (Uroleucon ambrosiae) TaxID=1005057 RepID=G2LPJ1_BUCUM|nr:flagellar basal body rod protein FlgB [Buchnera aphidicola]AEO08128.1 flagellar basal-body rod protein FlgB [Buchnera aphidicola str. Ua (Uroleucon ambrosiae)]
MFDKINHLFDFSQQALNLYAKRQEILSSNIANVDTPGYKAIDINFKNELNKMLNKYKSNICVHLKTTSPYHFHTKYKNNSFVNTIPVLTNQIKKDGNTVNIDRERIEFLNNSLKYQASLIFLKNEIKNIISVIKG